jgi:hypothetical protein
MVSALGSSRGFLESQHRRPLILFSCDPVPGAVPSAADKAV